MFIRSLFKTRIVIGNISILSRQLSQFNFETFGVNQMNKFFSVKESELIIGARDILLELKSDKDPLLSLIRLNGSEFIQKSSNSKITDIQKEYYSFVLHQLASIDKLGYDTWKKYCLKVPFISFRLLERQKLISTYTILSHQFKEHELQYVKITSRKLKRENESVIHDIVKKLKSKNN
jgi:hypothetical protein